MDGDSGIRDRERRPARRPVLMMKNIRSIPAVRRLLVKAS
jgi:hypothetical protein